jgi:O-acetyl-ADP-ribose deacetylase (regulator of RNase III)
MAENKSFGIKGILRYREGDALVPISAGFRIIVHICNDAGFFAKGFVVALSKKWPKTQLEYRNWWRSQKNFKLGEIMEVAVQSDTVVIHMIAQHDIKPDDKGTPPIRYAALAQCLEKVAKLAKTNNASIHGPRFGSGLSGGNWSQIEEIIKEKLIDKGISVTIYDLPKPKENTEK